MNAASYSRKTPLLSGEPFRPHSYADEWGRTPRRRPLARCRPSKRKSILSRVTGQARAMMMKSAYDRIYRRGDDALMTLRIDAGAQRVHERGA